MMPASLGGRANASPTLILDSWPVMEWLKRRQPTAGRFRELLTAAHSAEIALLLSSINLGEIYYNCWNEWNEARAEDTLAGLRRLPIRIIHPTVEDELAAAHIKARYKVAYADAFASVLAVEFDSPVFTGDPDFLRLRAGGVIAVEWVGV